MGHPNPLCCKECDRGQKIAAGFCLCSCHIGMKPEKPIGRVDVVNVKVVR